jgi:hypothetical protein
MTEIKENEPFWIAFLKSCDCKTLICMRFQSQAMNLFVYFFFKVQTLNCFFL